MAAISRRSGSGPVLRSPSPPRRFCSSRFATASYGSTSSRAASAFASSTFAARSSPLLHRSASPTRVNVYKSMPCTAPSVRFSLDRRQSSPGRSMSVSASRNQVVSNKPAGPAQKRTCMCSPTNHPGSFRCSLHKNSSGNSSCNSGRMSSYSSNKLERSAMANSLVRIGAVEGDLVKRALAALIRPSSHQQRRRENFKRRPSRLSVMSNADDS